MTTLFIDIETIPSQLQWVKDDIKANIKPPGNIKKPESIAAWMSENAEQEAESQLLKTSFNGAVGEIICIAWAFDDAAVQVVGREIDGSEHDMLAYFFDAVISGSKSKHGDLQKQITWCGHYITGFDLHFLWQRMIVNNVKTTVKIPHNAKPWSADVFDTCHEWKGDTSGFGSLDAVAKILGIEQTKTMSGADVWPEIQSGNYAKVFDYCKADVEIARQVYDRIK